MPFLGVMKEDRDFTPDTQTERSYHFFKIYDERFSNKLENKTGTLILQNRTYVPLCS